MSACSLFHADILSPHFVEIGIFSLDGIELQPDPGYVPPEPEVCDVVDEVASLELEAKYYGK